MRSDLSDDELLAALPLKRTWLDDIVDICLHQPDGTAEIEAILLKMMHLDRDIGAVPESTITRTINNYCSDANDYDRVVKHDLFARVGPSRYRLRSYPEKPDLFEIQNVCFTDIGYESTWNLFRNTAKKNPKWENMTRRKRLVAFARNIQPGARCYDELQARLRFFQDVSNDTDIWAVPAIESRP
jgi:hypothetical protein